MVGAMAEESLRRGIDAICPATEIDAVEIELEDLLLGEFPLEREGQNALLDLSREAAVVGQEDVAGQLLRDGRCRTDPALVGDARDDRTADAERIDAEVAAEPAVLDRDHRRSHFGRDLVVRKPAPQARPDRHQHRAVSRADADIWPRSIAF